MQLRTTLIYYGKVKWGAFVDRHFASIHRDTGTAGGLREFAVRLIIES